ncbi:AMP-binding protein [Photorhabdus heterorhabditis]|nr:AMP-binding protein [Photorhabdus heterorhabditis subsp. aluminescens]
MALLGGLRHCITAGEPLPASLARRVREALPGLQLWNNYGCSELNDITYRRVTTADGEPGAGSTVPAGRPIDNSSVFIVDGQRRRLPVGVTGEICVAGAGVSLGYFGQTGLTAEKFIGNPFPGSGPTLYLTGDAGRLLADGSLEYCGRRDFDIKIRGYRIDVQQVEEALLAQPEVSQAVAGAVRESDASRRLVAWIVWQAGALLTPQMLRDRLLAQLPAYMVPGLYVSLDALPQLPNGKLDRRSLPAPQTTASRMGYVAPGSETERRLAGLWEEVLQLEGVSADDDFFNLGGHSLLTMQLFSRIKETFKVNISVSTIVSHPTIQLLSHVIDSEIEDLNESTLIIDLKKSGSENILFLIHPIGGEISMYLDLAQHINSEFDICAIQSHEVARCDGQAKNIEDLARQYGDMIKERQGKGPYRMLGWSSGGLFALAVVNYLEATGNKVAYLGLIDPSPFPKNSMGLKRLFIEAVIITLSSVVKRFIDGAEHQDVIDFLVTNEISSENIHWDEKSNLMFNLMNNLATEEISHESCKPIVDKILVTLKHLSLLVGLKPKKLNSEVNIYLAKDGITRLKNYSLGKRLGDILIENGANVEIVNGDHYDMLLKPHVEKLAYSIDSKL